VAETPQEVRKSVSDISNELEFARWYNEIEDGLLEASYEEYQYAQSPLQI